jgi:hypothetical protein
MGARNNLAMTMLDLSCPQQAREQLERIDIAQLKQPLRDAVTDTRAQLEAGTPAPNAKCGLIESAVN